VQLVLLRLRHQFFKRVLRQISEMIPNGIKMKVTVGDGPRIIRRNPSIYSVLVLEEMTGGKLEM
jgi:hypothetical protein